MKCPDQGWFQFFYLCHGSFEVSERAEFRDYRVTFNDSSQRVKNVLFSEVSEGAEFRDSIVTFNVSSQRVNNVLFSEYF